MEKAWELHRHPARFPEETILRATEWLEARYSRTPGENLALALAIRYLILAFRQDAASESERAREYCARAARWRIRGVRIGGARVMGRRGGMMAPGCAGIGEMRIRISRSGGAIEPEIEQTVAKSRSRFYERRSV